MSTIHTFDCRDNVMFRVLKEMTGISNEQMLHEIQSYHALLINHLSKKGINYADLRSSLVPNQERKEVALIFDRSKIEDSWYSAKVFERVVPLLNVDANHSFLTGDFIVHDPKSEKVKKVFLDAVESHSPINYVASNQFYVIYTNNLTEGGVDVLTQKLKDWDAYVGHADMTYSSLLKILFSQCLAPTLIKFGKKIIQPSCGADPESDINTMGYCFDDYGYTFVCVDDDMYGVFLCYKIERPVFEGFEEDTTFTLNAVTTNIVPLSDMEVNVEEAKLNWLKQNKTDSLERAGLLNLSTSELESLIKKKIESNYIYSIDKKNFENEVIKFNMILEFDGQRKTRLMASLEYNYQNKTLRLITLY